MLNTLPRHPRCGGGSSRCHTRLGWWAIGLSGTFWVLEATVDFTDGLWVLGTEAANWDSVVYWPVLSAYSLAGVAGTVVALITLLRYERSALVWLAMVAGLPAFLWAGFILLVLSDGLGGVPTLWVMVVLVGVIGVLIAWLQRHKSGEPR